MSKLLGIRNKSEAELVDITEGNGYSCFIPRLYANQLSMLKTGCPIWIEMKEGKCAVFEMMSDDADKEMNEAIECMKRLGYIL